MFCSRGIVVNSPDGESSKVALPICVGDKAKPTKAPGPVPSPFSSAVSTTTSFAKAAGSVVNCQTASTPIAPANTFVPLSAILPKEIPNLPSLSFMD